MNEILVSIIIPVYNAEKFLKECLDSILLEQDINKEIIVVDNGSTDNSKKVVEDYLINHKDIVLLEEKNKGVSYARNTGIKASRGQYICFLDADDYLYPNALKDLLEATNKEENVDLVIGNYTYLNGKLKLESDLPTKTITSEVVSNLVSLMPLCDWAVWGKLYRRNLIVNNNIFFNTNYITCEDCDFLFNYLDYTNTISLIKKVVLFYRNDVTSSLTKQKSFLATKSEFMVLASKIESYASSNNWSAVSYFSKSLLLKVKQIANLNKGERQELKQYLLVLKKNLKYINNKDKKISFILAVYKLFGFTLGAKILILL